MICYTYLLFYMVSYTAYIYVKENYKLCDFFFSLSSHIYHTYNIYLCANLF